MAAVLEAPAADIRQRMARMYRPQKHIYDATRRYYLLGRDRLIAGLDLEDGQSLLDVGCGTGRNLALIGRRYPAAKLHGLDAAEPMLEVATARLRRAKVSAGLAHGVAEALDPAGMFGIEGGFGLAIDTGRVPPQSEMPGTARRLDPSIPNYFSDRFDALELWVGDDRYHVEDLLLGQNIGDWFNLLNQGIVRTGVSDSDTHQRFSGAAGMPRTMVASPTDAPGDLDTIADLQRLPGMLKERGYSDADIEGIAHGNWVRFLQNAWKR